MFAPSRLYGTPDDCARFVDAAHRLGLGVILDVVYNHFGPAATTSRDFSADCFSGATGEWGDALNFDGPGRRVVREFIIANAAYWIEEYHFDGLRLDATQAITTTSPEHIISELSRAARAAAGSRTIFMVGENEPQDTRLLKSSGVYPDGLDAIGTRTGITPRLSPPPAGARRTSPTISAPRRSSPRWRASGRSIKGSGTRGSRTAAAASRSICRPAAS